MVYLHVLRQSHGPEHFRSKHATVANFDPSLEFRGEAENFHGWFSVGIVGRLEFEIGYSWKGDDHAARKQHEMHTHALPEKARPKRTHAVPRRWKNVVMTPIRSHNERLRSATTPSIWWNCGRSMDDKSEGQTNPMMNTSRAAGYASHIPTLSTHVKPLLIPLLNGWRR
jgi:hypothetical protein